MQRSYHGIKSLRKVYARENFSFIWQSKTTILRCNFAAGSFIYYCILRFRKPITLGMVPTTLKWWRLERLRYPGVGLRVRVASFSFRFLLMSALLPVISTRFPAVNPDLHVNVKRVNLEKEYGEACKYFNDFITHKISDKKAYYKISIFTSCYVDYRE